MPVSIGAWLADLILRVGMALADRVIEAENRKATQDAIREANLAADELERAKFGVTSK